MFELAGAAMHGGAEGCTGAPCCYAAEQEGSEAGMMSLQGFHTNTLIRLLRLDVAPGAVRMDKGKLHLPKISARCATRAADEGAQAVLFSFGCWRGSLHAEGGTCSTSCRRS